MTDLKQEENFTKVGKYGFILIGRTQQIAKGVFRGRFDHKDVVVKRVERFEGYDIQELYYLRSFRHENVVQYFFNDADHDFLYIVLEKCDCTLAEFVKDKKHEGLWHLGVLWQITKGMVYLHEEKDFVNRDLNPSNILMTHHDRRWIAKITDFTICKQLQPDRTRVTQSFVKGTGSYMAPEQMMGYTIGKSTDIFSCGLVFHYVLSEGEHPFGSNIAEAERRMRAEDATPDLSNIKDEYKHDSEPLILAMISHKPEDRLCIREVQAHHLFWTSKKKLLFCQHVYGYILPSSPERVQKMRLIPDVKHIAHDWKQTIRNASPIVGKEIDNMKVERNPWQGDEISDLLRFIRNMASHYGEQSPESQEEIGSMPDGFYQFFKNLFPKLLSHVYQSMKPYKAEERFQDYYTYREEEDVGQKSLSDDATQSEKEKAWEYGDSKKSIVDRIMSDKSGFPGMAMDEGGLAPGTSQQMEVHADSDQLTEANDNLLGLHSIEVDVSSQQRLQSGTDAELTDISLRNMGISEHDHGNQSIEMTTEHSEPLSLPRSLGSQSFLHLPGCSIIRQIGAKRGSQKRGHSDDVKKAFYDSEDDHVSVTVEDEIWLTENIMIYKNHPLRSHHHVYKGSQFFLDRKVKKEIAVKIFLNNEKYLEEVQNMVNLEPHSNVVQFVQCGKDTNNKLGGFFIAMSLCHKKTLADIDLEYLSMEERRNIFLQVCHGLEHLHSHGISHLNLKPSNILFSRDGRNAVLSNFELSKKFDVLCSEKGGTTTFQHFLESGGAVGWRAAELLQQPMPCSSLELHLADIFSLGLLGHYTISCGFHPFAVDKHPNRQSICEVNIIEKNPPNFSHLQSQEDGEIASHLIGRMLGHDPEKRPVIDQVLSHMYFWNSSKKVQFMVDMYDCFLHRKSGFFEDATLEQKLLFESIPTEEKSPWSRGPTVSISRPHFFESREEREEERKIMEEMSEVAGSWIQKVQEAQPERFHLCEKYSSCTIQQLIRFIRNHHAQEMRKSTKGTEKTWEFFSKLFPKLLIYVYETLEPAFSKSHQAEYKFKTAWASDIDLKHVLSDAKH